MKSKKIKTILVGLIGFLCLGIYNQFILQNQADVSVDQLNGGDLEFGLAKAASEDYSGVIVFIMLFILCWIWVPVVCSKLSKKDL